MSSRSIYLKASDEVIIFDAARDVGQTVDQYLNDLIHNHADTIRAKKVPAHD